jgi:acyl-CoA synthetase (AMP-forming)/AMP-acid ligase II
MEPPPLSSTPPARSTSSLTIPKKNGVTSSVDANLRDDDPAQGSVADPTQSAAYMQNICAVYLFVVTDALVVTLPLFHVHGLMCMVLSSLAFGADVTGDLPRREGACGRRGGGRCAAQRRSSDFTDFSRRR